MFQRISDTFSKDVWPRLETNVLSISGIDNFRDASHVAGQQRYARADAFQRRFREIVGEGRDHCHPSISLKGLDRCFLILVGDYVPRNRPSLGAIAYITDSRASAELAFLSQ